MPMPLSLFDLGYHPEDAAAAADACRQGAADCRQALAHFEAAADAALAGWTGTARDGFVAVAGDHASLLSRLADDLDGKAADIERAAAAAAAVRSELVRHEAEVRRLQEQAERAEQAVPAGSAP